MKLNSYQKRKIKKSTIIKQIKNAFLDNELNNFIFKNKSKNNHPDIILVGYRKQKEFLKFQNTHELPKITGYNKLKGFKTIDFQFKTHCFNKINYLGTNQQITPFPYLRTQ